MTIVSKIVAAVKSALGIEKKTVASVMSGFTKLKADLDIVAEAHTLEARVHDAEILARTKAKEVATSAAAEAKAIAANIEALFTSKKQ